jgi:hypothetical protein
MRYEVAENQDLNTCGKWHIRRIGEEPVRAEAIAAVHGLTYSRRLGALWVAQQMNASVLAR